MGSDWPAHPWQHPQGGHPCILPAPCCSQLRCPSPSRYLHSSYVDVAHGTAHRHNVCCESFSRAQQRNLCDRQVSLYRMCVHQCFGAYQRCRSTTSKPTCSQHACSACVPLPQLKNRISTLSSRKAQHRQHPTVSGNTRRKDILRKGFCCLCRTS